MNGRFRTGRGRGGRRLVALAVPLAGLLPLAVSATVEISSDSGTDTPSGDPLDSNDFGGGGGNGERYQPDPTWPAAQTAPSGGISLGGRRVLLLPVSQGGLLTFRLVIIDEQPSVPEAADAR